MPISKTVTQVLSVASLAAGATSSRSTSSNTSNMTLMGVTFRGTLHASATLGATVFVDTSPDDSNWDTKEYQSVDIDYLAGVVQRTFEIIPVGLFVAFRVKNEDAGQVLANITITVTKQLVT